MGEQRPWFGAQVAAGLAGQQAHKGVVGQVGGIAGVAQLAVQPAVQPSMVFAVQVLDMQIERRRHADHRGAPER
jgi:hypothetical protein